MPATKSQITCTIGKMEFTVSVEWSYNPGEPMVRYYADGSGYPGSPPEFDCINFIRCEECEYRIGPFGQDEWGNCVGGEGGWGYAAREDRPDAFRCAEKWILADLEAGLYCDDLFDNAEESDYDD